MKQNTIYYLITISTLIAVFSVYNYTLYNSSSTQKLTANAQKGQTIWQKNNCNNCHQLYGLGGYLGPDLTNIYSNPKKGPQYIKAMLKSGIKSMPEFKFSNQETEALLTFLKEVDKTGYYPNHNANINSQGWVEISTKNEK